MGEEAIQKDEEKSERDEMEGKFQELQQSRQEEEIKELGVKLNKTEATAASYIPNLPLARAPEVTIRREFRICGQIGEGGQRDKLSYNNLLHQIESGLRKGDGESDVIEAVIRAISSGFSFETCLK